MDQQSTIFDETFEAPVRRRELLPQWMQIYMWFIIYLGIAYFIWALFFSSPIIATRGASYQLGTLFRKYAPGIIIFLMGALVWQEKESAIRFNRNVAIIWGMTIIGSVLYFGMRGFINGALFPVFIPYWIGLLPKQQKWEKESIRGKNLF